MRISNPAPMSRFICAALTGILISSASAQMPDPMVDKGKTQQLADHSYVILDRNVPFVPNVGFVVGEHSTLIIDTGSGRANGEIVLAEALELDKDNQLYLATTHFHPEHDLGASAFPDNATMIRSEDQVREIEVEGLRLSRMFQNMSPAMKELLAGEEFRAADITFEDEYVLDLGGVTVTLMAVGPAHTLGDTAFYVPEDKVLYSGDLTINSFPSLASQFSDIATWSNSLDEFEALEVETIVPSHRELVEPDIIPVIREYLSDLLSQAEQLENAGTPRDEARETIKQALTAKYTDWTEAANPMMLNMLMQGASNTAFKVLDRRPEAGPETN